MLAAIGIGANLGEAEKTVRLAMERLQELGRVTARSRLYRTRPWGEPAQPPFVNAAVLLQTELPPRELLVRLGALERALGRTPSYRWGPRQIDLDILTLGDLRVDEPDLQVPHPRLWERAFVLAPLSEIDPVYRAAYEALPAAERAGVRALETEEVVERAWGERVALMPDDHFSAVDPASRLAQRVRALCEAFVRTDLLRLRITDANEDAIELRRSFACVSSERGAVQPGAHPEPAPAQLDVIRADLVGIVHFSKSLPQAGERIAADRELAHVEALGIRNPVKSRGVGRLVSVLVRDGQPVDYGHPLFEIDRG